MFDPLNCGPSSARMTDLRSYDCVRAMRDQRAWESYDKEKGMQKIKTLTNEAVMQKEKTFIVNFRR